MRRLLVSLALLLLSPAKVLGGTPASPSGAIATATPPVSPDSQQLLLVRSIAWWASSGTLQRYERRPHEAWRPVGDSFPVDLGRSGMGWGRGLHTAFGKGPVKREGDRRSPAGVYALDTAFGAASSLPDGARSFPYLQTSSTTYCVEDARSAHYNELVDSTRVTPSAWEQWSEMARADGLFKWGVVVQQNSPQKVKGAGSCVFLHIWRGPNRPTSGCTAMAPEQIVTTLKWLDAAKKPLLAQLPDPVLREVREAWDLP